MKQLYNLLKMLVGSLVFLVFNCADCSSVKKEPSCNISNEFKSYVIFGEGTYWVYKSDVGILDTTKIISVERTLYDGSSMYPTEAFRIQEMSTQRGSLVFDAICGSNSRIGCQNYSIYTCITFGYNQTYFFCCCEPGSTGDYYITYLGEDTATVNNTFYPQLKSFKSDSVNTESIKQLYYAINIGLVKYEDYQGNKWELFEYSINEY